MPFSDNNAASNNISKSLGGFPAETYKHDAFIGFHGSWNRDTPTGYKVVHVPFNEVEELNGRAKIKRMLPSLSDAKGNYKQQVKDFLWNGRRDKAKWRNGFRPVDVKFDQVGRLLVSSDGTRRGRRGFVGGMVVMIIHRGGG